MPSNSLKPWRKPLSTTLLNKVWDSMSKMFKLNSPKFSTTSGSGDAMTVSELWLPARQYVCSFVSFSFLLFQFPDLSLFFAFVCDQL